MEVVSLLAGEPFTDRPRCVDPAVSAYLRALNDLLGHADRQRLAPYAPRCVDTRAGRALTRRRRGLCLAFAGARSPLLARVRIAVLIGVVPALRLTDGAGELAARAAVAERDVDAALGLLEALLAEGGHGAPLSPAPPPPGSEAPPLPDPVAVGA